MLAQFIHLADYMVVESLLLLVMTVSDSFYQDLAKPSKKSGLFNVTLSMERNKISFAPEEHEVSVSLSGMLDSMVSCVNSVPRLLYMAAFKPHFDDKQKVTGPHLGDMIRTSSVFNMICLKIENVVKTDFSLTREYAVFAEQYFPIYNYADEFNKESFANQDHIANSRSIKREMLKLRQWGQDLERMKLANVIGIFGVDSKTLRNFLIERKSVVLEDMKSVLHTAARDSCADVLLQFQQRIKSLRHKPANLKDFASFVETKNVIAEDVKTLLQASTTVDEMYKLLSSFDVKIPSQEQVKLDDLHTIHGQFSEAIDTAESDVSAKIAQMAQALNQEIAKLDQELMEIMTDLASAECTNPKAESTAVLEMLDDVRSQIERIQEKADQYTHYQKLFNMTPHEYTNLTSTRELFDEKFELWESLRLWEEMTSGPVGWRSQVFTNLRPEDMEKEAQANLKIAVRIFKKREDDVALRFKDDTMKWKSWMPTLVALGNPALRTRHWEQVFAKLGRPYEKDMTLDQLIQWDVFRLKELVEEVSGVASGEYALELQLEKIEKAWKNFNFVLNPYRESKDVFILGGLEEVMMQLEDNQSGLQTMLASRFVLGIRDKVEAWDRKLALLSETLDEWLAVQRAWMYLESIFGAPDIQKQLPQETVQFLRVDQNWKDMMRKTKKRPNVVEAACAPGVLEMFQEANKVLEKIQKSLEDYLETKRMGFPRFYFLSNDELLEILSQTRDPRAVQPHLRKCFDAMQSADFENGPPLEEEGDPVVMIVGMNSAEKEKVPFSRHVPTAPKSVEFWMCDLEDMMRQSLLDQTIAAREAYNDDVRETWFFDFPAASISTIDQVFLCLGVPGMYTHTHTHIHIHTYICIQMLLCKRHKHILSCMHVCLCTHSHLKLH
jgi:dynein heavy chain